MLARTVTRVLGQAEFLYRCCVLRLATGTCVLVFLIGTTCCARTGKLNLGSELPSTEVGQQDTQSSQNGKDLRHQSSRDNGTELTSSELSGVYEDYDDVDLSYVAPEVLVDLGPEEMILSLKQDQPPQGRRKPVKDGFVRDQEMELLRLHNFYRGNVTPTAADMSFMEWDDELAKVAQDWANRCEFRHGFPPNSYPGVMGQNLYMGFDPTGVRAMLLWYEEHQHYNLKTSECESLKPGCGHYTQMVWSQSSLVGCGMKRCGYKRFLVVCHYNPPGNVGSSPPYTVGKPCSQCSPDLGGLCASNLCVTEEQCTRNKGDCGDPECPLECHNCGILNSTICKCSCADGWDSLDCSRRCRNDHEGCGKRNGFPTVTYCSIHQYNVANVFCREMCGRCRNIENLNSTSTCCNGVLCEDGYVIDEILCECKLLCPGSKCHVEIGLFYGNTSEQDSGPPHKNISNEGRGPLYKNISDEDKGKFYKNISDESTGLLHTTISGEGNGSLDKNISDEDNITIRKDISDEDNGSQYSSTNIHTILLALIVQTPFLS